MPLLLRPFSLALLLYVCATLGSVARADVILLIHGYLGDANSWRSAGVEQVLDGAGWHKRGVWIAQPQGAQLVAEANSETSLQYYAVGLPSTAPLMVQATALQAILEAVTQRHPSEPLHLVGHSAGGVVARLALVLSGAGNVQSLITIASPHLGTERAWQAIEAANGSGIFAPIKRILTKHAVGEGLYQALQNSAGLLSDLGPAVPGSLLAWLNQQLHPDVLYVSIVRTAAYDMGGDMIVPAYSQDMNQVPMLRGRSQVIPVVQQHLLTPQDGHMLVEMLQRNGSRS